MNVRQKAAIALTFVVFELSFWSIFLKVGGNSIGILPQLFYGFLVGLIVSLALSLAIDRGGGIMSIVKDRRMLIMVIIIGLLNNALTQLFLGIGTLGTNPSVGAIVYRSYVIMVALLTPLIIKQKVKRMQMLACVIGFLGIYVILSGGTLFTFNASTAPFMILLLVSALCTTFSALFINRYTFNALGAVVIFNLASLLFISGLAAATNTSLIVTFTPSAIVSVLFLGAFAYGIGTALVYYSIKVYGPLLFGNVILLVPFLTIFFASLVAGTPVLWYYLLAAILMSTGVILQRRYSKVAERATSNKLLQKLTIFDITGAFISNKGQVITNQIRGGNRALAIKLDKNITYDAGSDGDEFRKRNCIVFTSNAPHEDAKPDEIDFIKEIIGASSDETVLVAMGNPDNIESAFEEFYNG
jgi:drug/metabolite transporter (DMT)-like permease